MRASLCCPTSCISARAGCVYLRLASRHQIWGHLTRRSETLLHLTYISLRHWQHDGDAQEGISRHEGTFAVSITADSAQPMLLPLDSVGMLKANHAECLLLVGVKLACRVCSPSRTCQCFKTDHLLVDFPQSDMLAESLALALLVSHFLL